jgi:hypothetical protein
LVNVCEQMHCLPLPGGLFDQDSFFVYGMDIVVEAKKIKEDEDERKRARRGNRR